MKKQIQEHPYPEETIQIPVELVLPLVIHTKETTEGAVLSEEDEILIKEGFMTRQEAVSFYSFQMLVSGIASSRTEFITLMRSVMEVYNRNNSKLIKPAQPKGGGRIITEV